MNNWKDFPRTKDKVALVGFHENTRDAAPYDDPEYEIWSLNEEYRYDWLKRTDRHFQLHPKWDFSRTNNMNDPNHFLWLKNQSGDCIFCKGLGKIPGGEADCPYCDNGIYHVPESRNGLPIYMQREWKDIPNSIALPLNEMTKAFLPHRSSSSTDHYYTSSPSYMLVLAMLLGFQTIRMFGFDMGTKTEYHYQKANMEYLIGIAHGRGIDVQLPGSTILTGLLYGYENMRTGYRQQLEMRKVSLNQQFSQTKSQCIRLEGKLELLSSLKNLEEIDVNSLHDETRLKLAKREGILNFINGAKTETDNLTSLYDSYFTVGTEEENEAIQTAYEDNTKYVTATYKEEEK